jgi:FtsH-binding integral membrane protein
METYTNTFGNTAADALPDERAAFIRRTYAHLAGAVLLFIAAETYLIVSGAGVWMAQTMLGGRFSWLIVLGAFMGVSWLANWWANSQTSRPLQYMGLFLYIVAETIIFLPLLFLAKLKSGGGEIILQAGIMTAGLFAGLTAVVFLTRKDFSFMGPILAVGGFVALGFIAASLIFGFTLGNLFAFVMVLFAGGAILYDTSNILHRYRTDQHVAASLSLFASVALLFWYVLRIFMSSRN